VVPTAKECSLSRCVSVQVSLTKLRTHCTRHAENINQYTTQHWLAGQFITKVELLWSRHQVLTMA